MNLSSTPIRSSAHCLEVTASKRRKAAAKEGSKPVEGLPFFAPDQFPEQLVTPRKNWLPNWLTSLFCSPALSPKEKLLEGLLDDLDRQLSENACNIEQIEIDSPKVVEVSGKRCTVSLPLTDDHFYVHTPSRHNVPLTKFVLNGKPLQFCRAKCLNIGVWRRNGEYVFTDYDFDIRKQDHYWLFGEHGRSLTVEFKPVVYKNPIVRYEDSETKQYFHSENPALVKKGKKVMERLITRLKQANKKQDEMLKASVRLEQLKQELREAEQLRGKKLSL